MNTMKKAFLKPIFKSETDMWYSILTELVHGNTKENIRGILEGNCIPKNKDWTILKEDKNEAK